MDELRWILLAVAVVIVVAVYFWSRSRKQDSFYSSTQPVDEIPSFTARDEDGWVDGVGPVRVVATQDEIHIEESIQPEPPSPVEDTIPEAVDFLDVGDTEAEETEVEAEAGETSQEPETTEDIREDMAEAGEEAEGADSAPAVDENDVISLYLIVRDRQPIKGEAILSAALGNHLEYGEMKIFHRKDGNGKIIFSMANMLEPGYFDPDTMHSMETRGVSFFIQLGLCDEPVKALDDMLICAHTMANLLGTHLCDQNRQILDEVSTRAMREKAKRFN